MAINPADLFYGNNLNPNVNFGSMKDINLYYIKSKRLHLLPERMKMAVTTELKAFNGNYRAKGIRSLLQLHKDTYKTLADAQTLEDAQKMFPEFSDLIDFSTVTDEFPRLTKIIKAHGVKPEDFSLSLLKKLWFPTKLEDICEEYGFANRTSLTKLLERINMPRYDKNYTILMQTSEEAGNRAVAEKAVRTMTPEASRSYLQLANIANKTPEARIKQANSIRKFYTECPLEREKLQEISRLQWEECSEIKHGLSEFLNEQPSVIQMTMAKKIKGLPLSDKEKATVKSFYKRFWQEHPEFRQILSEARSKAANEINRSWNA